MDSISVALAGNPNAGKSTIFNALTGLRQHTGNWPGKTVEKKEGACEHNGTKINLVDLPGAYSLAAYSPEELIARHFLVEQTPDVVINVLDATNLERNLYLTVQILELGVPLVVVLNMADELYKDGIKIDRQALSELLNGAPVIETTANRGKGMQEVLEATVQVARTHKAHTPFILDYGREAEQEICQLEAAFLEHSFDPAPYTPRWLAVKLIENDPDIFTRAQARTGAQEVFALAQAAGARLQDIYDEEPDLLAADRRYGFINGAVRQTVQRPLVDRLSLTEKIDNIVTHKWLGLPVFFFVMYLIFRLVIDVSSPFLDWTDTLINTYLATWFALGLEWLSAPAWLTSLLIDGMVAGVGGVLVFVPGLLILYFFLALLEDSGYMSRAAFVMDKFMRVVGLHGKSFIPMILGFGCAVPAIYATRTIPSLRDRILTALLVPLMSCSARLPVYVVFGLAFFGKDAGTVIWALYALGILIAMLAGMLFTRTLLKPDTSSAFVLEMPPYRQPSLKSVTLHMWENTREFVKKAGTVILAFSIIMWILLNLPLGVENQRDSYFGQASALIAPVFAPIGFDRWETAGALITGFVAKEIVVSTLSQIYLGEAPDTAPETARPFGQDVGDIVSGLGMAMLDSGKILLSIIPGVDLISEEDEPQDTVLSRSLQEHFTPLSAFAFLVFVLLYVPCIATLGAIRHEFGASWAVVSALYQTGVAWLAAFIVYQGGTWLGLG
jgi:ferrous iron transport protein B